MTQSPERRRTTLRIVGVVVILLGVAVVGWGFHDFATAPPEDGAPLGFFLLPVGGIVAMVGFGLVSRSFGLVSSAFTEAELDAHRRRDGDG